MDKTVAEFEKIWYHNMKFSALLKKEAAVLSDNRAIGLFDSGIGGLTVAKEIMKALPDESIVYFGDTGRVPYGTKSHDIIKKYALQDEKFLLKNNVKLIVAACGTVSSVAYDTGKTLPVPFVEVVSNSVKAAVRATVNKKIGVLATSATIKTQAHKKQILKLIPDAEVIENSATMLVSLVEAGWTDKNDPVVKESVRRYLEPMKNAGVDTLILGCTHFPVLEDIIAAQMGEGTALINMGTATAQAVKEQLESSGLSNDGESLPEYKFFVSDKTEAFEKTAATLLGMDIKKDFLEQVDIEAV